MKNAEGRRQNDHCGVRRWFAFRALGGMCHSLVSMGMWFNPNSRGSRFRIWQPWGCKSLHAHQFHGAWPQREQQTGSAQTRTALGVQVSPRRPIWNVHRPSEPGLGANECAPSGVWRKSTAFRQFCARSSKRAGGFIPRIALDQCRDPERYRTCAPFRTPERKAAPVASARGNLAGGRDRSGY